MFVQDGFLYLIVARHKLTVHGPSKFRRLDREKLAAKAEFKQLKEDGIIQWSTSPWSSRHTW
jgi:hypothetical protein